MGGRCGPLSGVGCTFSLGASHFLEWVASSGMARVRRCDALRKVRRTKRGYGDSIGYTVL